MEISVENKTVWCNPSELAWYNSYDSRAQLHLEKRIRDLAVWGWGKVLVDGNGNEVVVSNENPVFDNNNGDKLLLIKALCENYNFKLKKEDKYYWRKRAEHVASFEDISRVYLNVYTPSNEVRLDTVKEGAGYTVKFTETEARKLLQDDFNMFERVKINE